MHWEESLISSVEEIWCRRRFIAHLLLFYRIRYILHQFKADVSKTLGIMLLYYTIILVSAAISYIVRPGDLHCAEHSGMVWWPSSSSFHPRETAPVLSIIRRAFNGRVWLMRKSHLRFLRYANDPLLGDQWFPRHWSSFERVH